MSRADQYVAKTKELIEPILSENQFELVDLEYVKEGGEYYLRAYIDKEGGITIQDCELVSREMNPLLDAGDFIPDAYIFEVSSPGLTRPLKTPRDYERNLDKLIEIRTYRAIDKQKEFYGYLSAYDDDTVTICDDEEQEMTIQRKDIALIRQAIDF